MRLTLLISLLLCAQAFFAQSMINITGKVIDSKTKAPIGFAHIGIPEQGIGTTSGGDGAFDLKLPAEYANSVMTISFLGYETYKKKVSKIKSPLTIKLKQASNDLAEVVVLGEGAIEDIIRKAVAAIPTNYPAKPTHSVGFYRESRTDDKNNYRYLSEGVIDIYKTSYKSQKKGQVSLIEGRQINMQNPLDTIVRGGLTSGHMAPHRFDVVKNREDFLDSKLFDYYQYSIESMTSYDGNPVYVIAFEPDPNAPDLLKRKLSFVDRLLNMGADVKGARLRGKVYIDKTNYAIIRSEFEVTSEGLKKQNDYPLYAGRWLGNYYIVNYRKVNDKWYLSDALREGTYADRGIYSNEIKITSVDFENSASIEKDDRLSRGATFTRSQSSYNKDFWKDYNTTPLTAELAESVQQLEAIKTANKVFDADYLAALDEQRDSLYLARIEAEAAQYLVDSLRRDSLISANPDEDIPYIFEDISAGDDDDNEVGLHHYYAASYNQLATSAGQYRVNYLSEDLESTILTTSGDVPARDFEIVINYGTDIYLGKKLFIRYGFAGDFYNSIYREQNIGLGLPIKLSKDGGFNIKLAVQYANLKYARKIGQATNDFGKFKVDKKNFKAEKINLYLGQNTHNIKSSIDFAFALPNDNELFVRGIHHFSFAQKDEVWFWERKEVFRKKHNVALEGARLEVFENGVAIDGIALPVSHFTVAVGINFN